MRIHYESDNYAADLSLGRFLRHLAAMGYVNETGVDEYKPTNYSKAMSLDMIGDGYLGL